MLILRKFKLCGVLPLLKDSDSVRVNIVCLGILSDSHGNIMTWHILSWLGYKKCNGP